MLSQAPCARKPVTPHARHKLVRMARANSESFARAMMTALHDSTSDSPSSPRGLDFVDSLNGIDLYEDVARASESEAVAASTRLRSLCHIDAEIHDVVRRLTTTVSSSRVLPGIVETHELCSVLDESLTAERLSESEFPEYAGINWFVLHPEPTRDSALSRSGMFRASNSSDLQGHGPAVEFLVLAYQGIFRHRGRRGWVQWCQSIELSNFPVTPGDAKRGVLFSSGIVAVESATRRGQVGVCYAMGVDLSSSDVTERRFLENAVWKRVMKLAALKKSMARESLARTLSISSSEHERSSQSSQEVSPRENDVAATKPIGRSSRASSRSTNQPECEPKANRNESRSPTSPTLLPKSAPSRYAGWASKIQELRGQTTVKPVDKRRQRAQTMQPTPSQACPRHRLLSEEPETLEFRLSLYKDPDPVMDEFAQSPTGERWTEKPVSSSAIPLRKGTRSKSMSVGTGWVV